jgi:hypothetical protein
MSPPWGCLRAACPAAGEDRYRCRSPASKQVGSEERARIPLETAISVPPGERPLPFSILASAALAGFRCAGDSTRPRHNTNVPAPGCWKPSGRTLPLAQPSARFGPAAAVARMLVRRQTARGGGLRHRGSSEYRMSRASSTDVPPQWATPCTPCAAPKSPSPIALRSLACPKEMVIVPCDGSLEELVAFGSPQCSRRAQPRVWQMVGAIVSSEAFRESTEQALNKETQACPKRLAVGLVRGTACLGAAI